MLGSLPFGMSGIAAIIFACSSSSDWMPMVSSWRAWPWLTTTMRTVSPGLTCTTSGVKRIWSSATMRIVRLTADAVPGPPTLAGFPGSAGYGIA